MLTAASSRLIHGGNGTFDMPLSLSGRTIEPRGDGSGNYTIVLTFDQTVDSGNASITGTGSVSSVSFNGNNMIIGLSGVSDEQSVTVTATNVSGPSTDTLPSASVDVGFLIGDITGDGLVNVGDTIQVRNHAGADLDNTNFRYDVNIDGLVNVGDTVTVKSKSGDFLP